MATEIKVPTLGESVSEATVATWLKNVGDAVTADEPILELETDKVTLEVPAPASGVIASVAVAEGVTVEPDAILGLIDESATATAAPAASSPAAATAAPAATNTPAPAVTTDANASHQSPAVAKLVAENNVDASSLMPGSGKGGRVTKGDVLSALSASPAPIQAATSTSSTGAAAAPRAENPREERVKMSRLRQTIASRLKEAQNTAAMLTTFNEVDMSGIMAMRKKYQDDFVKRNDVKLGFMSFFVKAAIAALKELPAVNAEIDGQDIVYKNYYNIGVAVGTENGLVVPVLKDADAMSMADIEKNIAAFGKKARDGKLSMAEMSGGTFTISNGGIYGSMLSTPILNRPQSAILGMHNIIERPVAENGKVVIKPMMYLALSYDHRIIDGREAVTALVRIKEALEDPSWLLLG